MKNILLISIVLMSCNYLKAQIPGTRIDGPLKLSNGLEVKKGDTIKLGAGSNSSTGNFRFIYQPKNFLSGSNEIQFSKSFTGATLEILFFKRFKTGKIGEVVVGVVNAGGFNNAVNIEEAITSGEIVKINGVDVRAHNEYQQSTSSSKVDDLKKLKDLLDTGAITQDEYDKMKKKILD